jgi:hypothetical protein
MELCLRRHLETCRNSWQIALSHGKIKMVLKRQGIFAYGIMYRWFTDVSSLGLVEQARRLMHPDLPKTEEEIAPQQFWLKLWFILGALLPPPLPAVVGPCHSVFRLLPSYARATPSSTSMTSVALSLSPLPSARPMLR